MPRLVDSLLNRPSHTYSDAASASAAPAPASRHRPVSCAPSRTSDASSVGPSISYPASTPASAHSTRFAAPEPSILTGSLFSAAGPLANPPPPPAAPTQLSNGFYYTPARSASGHRRRKSRSFVAPSALSADDDARSQNSAGTNRSARSLGTWFGSLSPRASLRSSKSKSARYSYAAALEQQVAPPVPPLPPVFSPAALAPPLAPYPPRGAGTFSPQPQPPPRGYSPVVRAHSAYGGVPTGYSPAHGHPELRTLTHSPPGPSLTRPAAPATYAPGSPHVPPAPSAAAPSQAEHVPVAHAPSTTYAASSVLSRASSASSRTPAAGFHTPRMRSPDPHVHAHLPGSGPSQWDPHARARDWKSFMASVSGTDIARTWERPQDSDVVAPPPPPADISATARAWGAPNVSAPHDRFTAGSTAGGLARKREHIDRLRAELAQDAPVHQVADAVVGEWAPHATLTPGVSPGPLARPNSHALQHQCAPQQQQQQLAQAPFAVQTYAPSSSASAASVPPSPSVVPTQSVEGSDSSESDEPLRRSYLPDLQARATAPAVSGDMSEEEQEEPEEQEEQEEQEDDQEEEGDTDDTTSDESEPDQLGQPAEWAHVPRGTLERVAEESEDGSSFPSRSGSLKVGCTPPAPSGDHPPIAHSATLAHTIAEKALDDPQEECSPALGLAGINPKRLSDISLGTAFGVNAIIPASTDHPKQEQLEPDVTAQECPRDDADDAGAHVAEKVSTAEPVAATDTQEIAEDPVPQNRALPAQEVTTDSMHTLERPTHPSTAGLQGFHSDDLLGLRGFLGRFGVVSSPPVEETPLPPKEAATPEPVMSRSETVFLEAREDPAAEQAEDATTPRPPILKDKDEPDANRQSFDGLDPDIGAAWLGAAQTVDEEERVQARKKLEEDAMAEQAKAKDLTPSPSVMARGRYQTVPSPTISPSPTSPNLLSLGLSPSASSTSPTPLALGSPAATLSPAKIRKSLSSPLNEHVQTPTPSEENKAQLPASPTTASAAGNPLVPDPAQTPKMTGLRSPKKLADTLSLGLGKLRLHGHQRQNSSSSTASAVSESSERRARHWSLAAASSQAHSSPVQEEPHSLGNPLYPHQEGDSAAQLIIPSRSAESGEPERPATRFFDVSEEKDSTEDTVEPPSPEQRVASVPQNPQAGSKGKSKSKGAAAAAAAETPPQPSVPAAEHAVQEPVSTPDTIPTPPQRSASPADANAHEGPASSAAKAEIIATDEAASTATLYGQRSEKPRTSTPRQALRIDTSPVQSSSPSGSGAPLSTGPARPPRQRPVRSPATSVAPELHSSPNSAVSPAPLDSPSSMAPETRPGLLPPEDQVTPMTTPATSHSSDRSAAKAYKNRIKVPATPSSESEPKGKKKKVKAPEVDTIVLPGGVTATRVAKSPAKSLSKSALKGAAKGASKSEHKPDKAKKNTTSRSALLQPLNMQTLSIPAHKAAELHVSTATLSATDSPISTVSKLSDTRSLASGEDDSPNYYSQLLHSNRSASRLSVASDRLPRTSSVRSGRSDRPVSSYDAASSEGSHRPRHKVRMISRPMESIDEWQSSRPAPQSEGAQSPAPLIRPMLPSNSLASGSVSSLDAASQPTPEWVKSAPMGSPTAALLADGSVGGLGSQALTRASSVASSNGIPLQRLSLTQQNLASVPGFTSAARGPASIVSSPAAPLARNTAHVERPRRHSQTDDTLRAKTTMATVAITSAFQPHQRDSVWRFKKRNENSSSSLLEDMPPMIGLTAHTAPPRKVGPKEVLVAVIAVAIDAVDRGIVREKAQSAAGYGFVPGRSFCGRIVEPGWAVEGLRKGDIIFGLTDSQKSGALAEFLAVDHSLVAKAPEESLTTEQIAALPATGAMAFQVQQHYCDQLDRGSRVLILNAHDGVGLLTMQACTRLGLIIVAHVPPSAPEGYAIAQANGAHEVIVGEPLWAINSLHESSFDLVVDTIGGRRLYDASRRILAREGHFVTCYGDDRTGQPGMKNHLHSLRRTFFKKDKKHIEYEWIGVDLADNTREALLSMRRAAQEGTICPRLDSILALEDAHRAFDSPAASRSDAGTVVVRIC